MQGPSRGSGKQGQGSDPATERVTVSDCEAKHGLPKARLELGRTV